jgi:hypothetical protein
MFTGEITQERVERITVAYLQSEPAQKPRKGSSVFLVIVNDTHINAFTCVVSMDTSIRDLQTSRLKGRLPFWN